jgi:hypothetical protein
VIGTAERPLTRGILPRPLPQGRGCVGLLGLLGKAPATPHLSPFCSPPLTLGRYRGLAAGTRGRGRARMPRVSGIYDTTSQLLNSYRAYSLRVNHDHAT